MERLLRRTELEEILGLSRASIYRLIALGRFPAPLKIGISAVRWHPQDVRDWLAARPRITDLNGDNT